VSPTVVAASSESDIDVDDGQASEEAAEVQEQWVLFYECTDERGELSHWWPQDKPFCWRGRQFWCGEQALMWAKAERFGDAGAAEQIMLCSDQATAKRLGREVRGYVELTWAQERGDIAFELNVAKFRGSAHARAVLLDTGEARLAEAAPHDRVWGMGRSRQDAHLPWRGEGDRAQGLLGPTLERVRACMRAEVLAGEFPPPGATEGSVQDGSIGHVGAGGGDGRREDHGDGSGDARSGDGASDSGGGSGGGSGRGAGNDGAGGDGSGDDSSEQAGGQADVAPWRRGARWHELRQLWAAEESEQLRGAAAGRVPAATGVEENFSVDDEGIMRLHVRVDAAQWQGAWVDARRLRAGGQPSEETPLRALLALVRGGQSAVPTALVAAARELRYRWSVIDQEKVAAQKRLGVARQLLKPKVVNRDGRAYFETTMGAVQMTVETSEPLPQTGEKSGSAGAAWSAAFRGVAGALAFQAWTRATAGRAVEAPGFGPESAGRLMALEPAEGGDFDVAPALLPVAGLLAVPIARVVTVRFELLRDGRVGIGFTYATSETDASVQKFVRSRTATYEASNEEVVGLALRQYGERWIDGGFALDTEFSGRRQMASAEVAAAAVQMAGVGRQGERELCPLFVVCTAWENSLGTTPHSSVEPPAGLARLLDIDAEKGGDVSDLKHLEHLLNPKHESEGWQYKESPRWVDVQELAGRWHGCLSSKPSIVTVARSILGGQDAWKIDGSDYFTRSTWTGTISVDMENYGIMDALIAARALRRMREQQALSCRCAGPAGAETGGGSVVGWRAPTRGLASLTAAMEVCEKRAAIHAAHVAARKEADELAKSLREAEEIGAADAAWAERESAGQCDSLGRPLVDKNHSLLRREASRVCARITLYGQARLLKQIEDDFEKRKLEQGPLGRVSDSIAAAWARLEVDARELEERACGQPLERLGPRRPKAERLGMVQHWPRAARREMAKWKEFWGDVEADGVAPVACVSWSEDGHLLIFGRDMREMMGRYGRMAGAPDLVTWMPFVSPDNSLERNARDVAAMEKRAEKAGRTLPQRLKKACGGGDAWTGVGDISGEDHFTEQLRIANYECENPLASAHEYAMFFNCGIAEARCHAIARQSAEPGDENAFVRVVMPEGLVLLLKGTRPPTAEEVGEGEDEIVIEIWKERRVQDNSVTGVKRQLINTGAALPVARRMVNLFTASSEVQREDERPVLIGQDQTWFYYQVVVSPPFRRIQGVRMVTGQLARLAVSAMGGRQSITPAQMLNEEELKFKTEAVEQVGLAVLDARILDGDYTRPSRARPGEARVLPAAYVDDGVMEVRGGVGPDGQRHTTEEVARAWMFHSNLYQLECGGKENRSKRVGEDGRTVSAPFAGSTFYTAAATASGRPAVGPVLEKCAKYVALGDEVWAGGEVKCEDVVRHVRHMGWVSSNVMQGAALMVKLRRAERMALLAMGADESARRLGRKNMIVVPEHLGSTYRTFFRPLLDGRLAARGLEETARITAWGREGTGGPSLAAFTRKWLWAAGALNYFDLRAVMRGGEGDESDPACVALRGALVLMKANRHLCLERRVRVAVESEVTKALFEGATARNEAVADAQEELAIWTIEHAVTMDLHVATLDEWKQCNGRLAELQAAAPLEYHLRADVMSALGIGRGEYGVEGLFDVQLELPRTAVEGGRGVALTTGGQRLEAGASLGEMVTACEGKAVFAHLALDALGQLKRLWRVQERAEGARFTVLARIPDWVGDSASKADDAWPAREGDRRKEWWHRWVSPDRWQLKQVLLPKVGERVFTRRSPSGAMTRQVDAMHQWAVLVSATVESAAALKPNRKWAAW
jgi:ribA/ribD-fused uncharacterized protein